MINNKISVLAAILLICSSAAFAGDGSTADDYGGVSITHSTSPHNLSATGPGAGTTGDNGEACVYCHTPHASNTAFAGAPIWNKATPSGTFTMYGSTVAGTTADTAPASPSLACLSCHDGVSAIDSIVNAPGSGMGSLATGTTTMAQYITNTLATELGTAGRGNIGTNLANDHPVSITYDPTKASLRATTFVLPTTGGGWLTPGGVNTIASLLRSGKVECSSCHDPHNATGIAQELSKQVNYLRHTNKQSALCFGCHDK